MSGHTAFSSLSMRLARALHTARARLGIRRGLRAGGVYYKELTATPLSRALSRQGPGFKDFRVTFADGHKQIIRCNGERCYADVMGPDGLGRYLGIGARLRPGSRVLEIAAPPACTGYTGAWLARAVGESGAVVSLIADAQSATFASRRYQAPNLSIEHMPGELGAALAGEVEGAFDACLCPGLPENALTARTVVEELWRVLRPGGWLWLGGPRERVVPYLEAARAQEAQGTGAKVVIASDEPAFVDVLIERPGAADEPA